MSPSRGGLTTGPLAVVAGTIVSLFGISVGAVVGLTIANRPTGVVLELVLLMAAPTVTGLLALVGVNRLRYDLRNGTGDLIAEKAAALVNERAEHVARRLLDASPPAP